MSFGERRHPLVTENYFLMHRWSLGDFPYAFYTEQKLRTLHRNFGHLSVSAPQILLENAIGAKLEKNIVETIEKMKEDSIVRKKTCIARSRFKLTAGTSELRFNRQVQIDTMFFHGCPVLHMVDKETHFSAPFFLRKQSNKKIWNRI